MAATRVEGETGPPTASADRGRLVAVWLLAQVSMLMLGMTAGLRSRWSRLRENGEAGMATAEYAIVTLAAVAFAGLLLAILRGGEVREMLLGIIRDALSR
ncbi:DUF4244 domain-containing protein [Salana multivorans]